MGGPRDEDPPVLLESSPVTQSLNVKPEEITLTFDEYVKLENPSKGIVITPRINNDEVEFSALKNIVTIKLNQELEDSTTYVFNFQKSIVDISEENPAENLKLVFSTGNSIDSLGISGTVGYYFPPSKPDFSNIIVGIYPLGDTTDVFTAPPYYLSQPDTTGNFNITNIKSGNYLAYAWKDLNGTLKAEFKSEEYDFILDTLVIEKNIENVRFNLSKADLTPIRILRTSQFGKNFDIILNRDPTEITLESPELGKEFFYTFSENRLRIYTTKTKEDSIPFQISLQDSVGFTQDSLIWAKFADSDRKPDKLQITANSGKSFLNNLEIELKFNKPIKDINFDSLYITYDTASRIPITPSMLLFEDSTKMDLLKIKISLPDSLKQDIFTIKASDSTFYDVEGQYNESELSANYRKLKRENLADEISGRIIGAKPPFIIQLLNTKGELVAEQFLTNSDSYSFQLLEAGTFKIRVIEDSNGNKRWDPANFFEKRNAERVFYFVNNENKEDLVIRSGWSLSEQNIQAITQTGINKIPVDNKD
ncbi:Ig-like domain-containing domain [Algoriphagus boritolerans]|uniref:Ig-like domain-containing protein n=1 Tax=Algoriphagus boritolerans DSM 17298 = JCM 18970 TaxID=1120964 RepID=A0A1H5YRB7_9BACT|nr:Ig-like domain-containing domain [Algoriphagus boritolerans]SEG26548.1 Ig-like domain-containing protein [Algoriphagus boritolerans DSM 17298 = JCM 18970]